MELPTPPPTQASPDVNQPSPSQQNATENFIPTLQPAPLIRARKRQPSTRIRYQRRAVQIFDSSTKQPNSFACPFYKLDPDTFRDCRRFELSRVKDVKQHLMRKHKPPQCNRCYRTFDGPERLEHHIRSSEPCELSDRSKLHISDQQWARLNQQYLSRGKPVEHQWLDLWTILFPEEQRPQSVYLGNDLEETNSQLRRFWNNNRASIISAAISHHNETPSLAMHHDATLPIVFDRFVDCFLNELASHQVPTTHADNLHRNVDQKPLTVVPAATLSQGLTYESAPEPFSFHLDPFPTNGSGLDDTLVFDLQAAEPGPATGMGAELEQWSLRLEMEGVDEVRKGAGGNGIC